MKVGIGIPCHIDDICFLDCCIKGISQLYPKPFKVLIDINFGKKSLKEIRANLFNSLFNAGCDVILSCDADFYLFPDILNHVSNDKVISFAPIYKKHYCLNLTLIALIFNNGWSGCYSIPKFLWINKVKDIFTGFDTSVKNSLHQSDWKYEKRFSYYSLQPYRKESTKKLLRSFSLRKRFLWQLLRFKIAK